MSEVLVIWIRFLINGFYKILRNTIKTRDLNSQLMNIVMLRRFWDYFLAGAIKTFPYFENPVGCFLY